MRFHNLTITLKYVKRFTIAVLCVLLFLVCFAWARGTFSVTGDPICSLQTECQPDKHPACEIVHTCPDVGR